MAQLDKPVLPAMLYRYRPITKDTFEQEIAALCEPYLWMSKYRALNDPMEGFYTPPTGEKFDGALYRKLFTEKSSIGVCCLSDAYDNELMWSHYASSYSGVCVGYSTKSLLEGLPKEVHLARLAYDSVPPPIVLRDFRDKRRTAMRILSHKKASWAYEREWRLIGSPGKVPLPTAGCIKSIYFGSRISATYKSKLMTCLNGVEKYQLAVDGYAHSFDPVGDAVGRVSRRRNPPLDPDA